ncbi:protein LIFEGUARD 4-like [Nicotiana sylvestris]|uniref:BI1-like protein n=1 Tax=Nicotiana sylvestris TaxID=4096 RepID=A0A1U7Y2X1_NICSY|nr:PREDICTED: BI1-like protein [Nicotiana sylvestris]
MFKKGGAGGVDIESGGKGGAGGAQIYPGMTEDPKMRWAFIRKVYAIVCTQLLVTAVIATAMFFTPAVKDYMRTPFGFATLIVLIVIAFILCFFMGRYGRKHPWNYVLMAVFTLCLAFVVGAACAFKRGPTILTAAGLTVLITVSLTLYTFWAASRGMDFSFLGPFLFCASIVLIFFLLAQYILHLGREVRMVYSCLAALLFSAYIIYDTNNLIRNFTYDEYVIAAICLFGDIVNLFLALLGVVGE